MADEKISPSPETKAPPDAAKVKPSAPDQNKPPTTEQAVSEGNAPILKVVGKIREIPIQPPKQENPEKTPKASTEEKPPVPKAAVPKRSGKTGSKEKPADKSVKGSSSKTDKTATKEPKPQKDKVSQSKNPKNTPVRPADKGGSTEMPATEQPAEPTPPPRPVEEQKIVYLKISELHEFHTFREHPFKVVDNSPQMQELVSSIKEQGVFTPATVRPEKDGNGYEIIAGHCRRRGSELAGLDVLPCIIRDMTDHEAVQEMKNSNKQRGDPSPSELARLLDLEMEDIKHQGTKLKGVAEGDIGKRSAEIVGEMHNMNYKKVMRYIRLNSLVPELLDKVDAKTMGFMPAVELSYIKPKNQRLIAVSIDGEQASPSVSQAKRLRELDKDGKLTGDVIDGILCEEKKEVDKVIITTDELNMYFGKEYTPRKMKEQIISLLDEWKAKQPQEKKKPEQTAERG